MAVPQSLDSGPGADAAESLTAAQLAELDASIAEADRGALISADELLARLRQIP